MSDILRRAHLVKREIFDPTNKEHVESFKIFLRTGNWGDVQFWPEVPYTEAPATVMAKYARFVLNVKAQTDEERVAALAARGVIVFPKPKSRAEREAAGVERLVVANALMQDLLR